MKKTRLVSRLLFGANLVVVLATILGYLSPLIGPSTIWPLAFFGLGMPYLLLLNVIFALYWIFRRRAWFVISLVVLAMGYSTIPKYIQFNFSNKELSPNSFKVMSFNVRVFDLYMWTKEKSARNLIFDFLEKEDPDVLCLQEFYNRDEQLKNYEFKTLDTLVKILSAKNYHVHYTTTLRETDHWGLITFSKFPIENKGVVPFENQGDNASIFTDINVHGEILRVYNNHLASIKLENRDYKIMKTINDQDYSNIFNKSLSLLEKVKNGFIKRSLQADLIQKSISYSPYPVVVCGDFNDSPTSYIYNTIKGNLIDTYISSGSGLGRTYIGEFPSFRIDYILADSSLESSSYSTHAVELSDHHPVSVKLNWK
ncbi:endonuclease/exonuclease/phosphatase family protein [Vicingaceae bacterium]|nr:endonuclease/exonuclease/phosphatase family protein [Vicingaceae bacterium]MDB4061212.1 endonuclease/exonuclease/phosphatase family protein [Vicingaceae bacterium]MDB9963524.1 endonuclease/exonuclease/phosphatase family protein [Vicingaceae bacterium]MDC1451397.1 endonuclease/exonuclease/phosphatase family protein [Vicingaceae bacterium]